MELREGAIVYTWAGERVGHVDRVVIDPRTHQVTDLVVKKGLLLTKDKVVPFDLIDKASRDSVTLKMEAADLETLPDFEDHEYIPGKDEKDYSEYAEGQASPLIWYPPTPAIWWTAPGHLGYSRSQRYSKPDFVPEGLLRIPRGTVPLKKGAQVISSDGEHVGDVDELIAETEENVVTHLVVSRGLLLKTQKLVPTTWISEVLEDEIHLAVGSESLKQLPEYKSSG
jgi:uncharacterized protein YrrD